jgi:hypothetical protein
MMIGIVALSLASASAADDKTPLPLIDAEQAKACKYVDMVSAVRFTTGASTTQKELLIGVSKKARKLDGDALVIKSLSQNGASSNMLADAYKCQQPG